MESTKGRSVNSNEETCAGARGWRLEAAGGEGSLLEEEALADNVSNTGEQKRWRRKKSMRLRDWRRD